MTEEENTLTFTEKFKKKLNKPLELEEYLGSEQGGLILENVLLNTQMQDGDINGDGRKIIMFISRWKSVDDTYLFDKIAEMYNLTRDTLLNEILRPFLADRRIEVITVRGCDYRFKRITNVTGTYFSLYFESIALFN